MELMKGIPIGFRGGVGGNLSKCLPNANLQCSAGMFQALLLISFMILKGETGADWHIFLMFTYFLNMIYLLLSNESLTFQL